VSTPRHYKVHYINYPSLNFKVVVGPSQQFSIRPYECKIYNLNMNRFHNHMNQVPKFNALSTTHYMVLETQLNKLKLYKSLLKNLLNLKSKHYIA
jgi:hypothetical protein